MNRGRRGENVFSRSQDIEAFLRVLKESSEMFDLRVAAYCLMLNHYHLLIQTPLGNLSRIMRHVNGVYTQRYNRSRNIDGQLFRGRYKSVLVEEDSHLLELLRYIHRNPVRAGMYKSVGEYPGSSHHGYISFAKKWDWLYKEFLLGMFAEKKAIAKKKYLEFVNNEDSSEVTDFYSKKFLGTIFGTQDFIDWVKEKFYRVKSHAEIPQSRQLAPTIAEIKEKVCRCYGVEQQALEKSKRGLVNEPRNIAIYLARKRSGLALEIIGREFGLEKYSSVSSIVTRTEAQLLKNKNMQKRIEEIRRMIEKGQAKI
jgi:REP element-mobilizing transposase RayT